MINTNLIATSVVAGSRQQEYYPLTPSQQRMWIIHRLNKYSTAYNSPVVRKITGAIHMEKLEQAFRELIVRHEQLRAGFKLLGEEPVQYIHEVFSFELSYEQDVDEDQVATAISRFIAPFDLDEAGLLIRARLLSLDEETHILIVDMHHIISDLRSEDLVIRDLFRLYHDEAMPELPVQYKDLAVWLREKRPVSELKAEEDFWLFKLDGELPVIDLPVDCKRPAVFDFQGTILHFPLPAALSRAITALAAQHDIPVYKVCLTALFLLLNKYTYQEDLIIGMPREIRPVEGMENLVGLFINTLPIRAFTEKEKTFETLLKEVSSYAAAAQHHHLYDVGYLVDKLGIDRDPARNPLYDILFFHHKMHKLSFDKLEVNPVDFVHDKAEVDLTFGILETDGQLCVSIEYYAKIFKEETIMRMAAHYQRVLEEVTQRPEIKLRNVDFLGPREHKQLLTTFNETASAYPLATITALFMEQAEQRPGQTALIFGQSAWTYAELNVQTNRLAAFLIKSGTVAGAVVALMFDPSFEMVLSIFAVLKAGGTYLPLDPALPEERIAYILENSGATILLTYDQFITQTKTLDVETINVQDQAIQQMPAANIAQLISREAIAYIIYTSGSTGLPKGTKIRHFNVVKTVRNSNYLNVVPEDRILQLSSYVFDGSVFDFFGALLNGATLVLADKADRQDAPQIGNLFQEHGISLAMITTSLFNVLIDHMPTAMKGLRKILVGGEKASVAHMRKALSVLGKGKLLNIYGPTETTVFASFYPVDILPESAETVPIGYPLSNTRCYVMNGNTLLPTGIPGELCIAGDGLGAGYLDEKLTREKFVRIPLREGIEVYRTGDLVKWTPEGILEYIGRKDTQVKLRGYRIETAEIEIQLMLHPKIREAVVFVKENSRQDRYLQACFTLCDEADFSQDELVNFLQQKLPAYMIPASFVHLEAMPLTTNGKTDRKQLAALSGQAITAADSYLPPVTETELKLESIWCQLLDKEKISIRQNFFHSGGHSLTATILTARIQEELKVAVPLSEVFQHPTIAGLAAFIDWLNLTGVLQEEVRITKYRKRKYYPLSFSESMVYVHQNATAENYSYHSVFPMKIEGEPDKNRLEQAIRDVLQRHEAFRTAYVLYKGEPVKQVLDHVDFKLEYAEGALRAIAETTAELRKPYSFDQPPLFRAKLLKIAAGEYFLLMANHHIISDGVTEALFMKEISTLYRGDVLNRVKIQYKDYTLWEKEQWASGYYQLKEQFWKQQLQGSLPVLELPTEFVRPARMEFAGAMVNVDIDPLLTANLQNLAAAQHTTLFMLLFTAYKVLLHKYTAQDDLIVGVPMASRMHADMQDIVGMFVNMVPWRSRPEPDMTFTAYLNVIKSDAAAIYQHQDYPFEKLVSNLQLKRDPSRNPVFDTIFVLQNTAVPVLDLPGMKIAPHAVPDDAVKVDLTVEAMEYEGEIRLTFKYRKALFSRSRMERMAGHFIQLLSQLVADPAQQLGKIDILTAVERTQLLEQFNEPVRPFPEELSLYQLFEKQVDQQPDHMAIEIQDTTLTYLQLHQRAVNYAAELMDSGAQAGDHIAIVVERSVEMIVAIWAILRIDATYVPIDPDYPEERIAYILEDSQAKYCVTTFELFTRINFDGELMIIDQDQQLAEVLLELPKVTGANPAYVMYTSGSTGKPKGIAVPHHSVIRTVIATNYIDITAGDHILQLSNYAFDGSVFDIFGALLNGARLVLKRESVLDGLQLATLIREKKISVLFMTTALFNVCIEMDPGYFGSMRKVLFGGEQVSISHVGKAFAAIGPGKLIHVYGPTENTVFSTFFPVDTWIEGATIPIGAPLSHTQAYVLNGSNPLNPIGVPGELYLSGVGLSLGYWNQPELTKEKFIDHPFIPGALLYRTGDLVKWQDDGQLVFLGRIDQQLKIRGFRIEPGEIEAQLQLYPDVQQCVVMTRTNKQGEQKLGVYYTSSTEIHEKTLKAELLKVFPYYMVPDWFVRIPQLPLNANGKVDRKVLLSEMDRYVVAEHDPVVMGDFVAPENETQQLIAGIWCEVFGLEEVGIEANFYDLGGHSLKALQVVHLIQKAGYMLSVSDVFSYPTIRELAENCGSKKKTFSTVKRKRREPESSQFPLSAVQYRFFQRDMKVRNIFNSPFLIELKYTFSQDLIGAALQEILRRHPILTVNFRKGEEGQWAQYYNTRELNTYFKVADLQQDPVEAHDTLITEHCEILQQQFSIESGPLFKVILFDHYHEDKQLMLFLFHHLTFDGVSWQVLIDEFRQYCFGKTGHVLKKIKGTSYREWCAGLSSYAGEGDFGEAKAYWHKVLESRQPFLPDHRERPYALQKEMLHYHTLPLSAETDLLCLQEAVTLYRANVFHLLLAAFFSACKALQEREHLLLYLMSAQRESPFAGVDLERTVGFFAGAFPVCIELPSNEGQQGYEGIVEAVKSAVLGVPKGGLDYFVLKHMPALSDSHALPEPEFPVLFHYLNLISTVRDDAFYQPSRIPFGLTHSPDNPSAYLINITATMESNGLNLTFYYSGAHFNEQTIEALAAAFEKHLFNIIRTTKTLND